jgi:hypothetical protein
VNETLRRALLRARLSEDDVAAHLQVDPKTVRRWLEGRLPYLRHRWALVGLLDADEADLWPEVRARSRPAEIKAVYPNRNAVPRGTWLSLFGLAEEEIGILADSGEFLARQPGVLGVLASQARDGVRLRICLQDPGQPIATRPGAPDTADAVTAAEMRGALNLFAGLRDDGAEVRVHQAVLYSCVCHADDQSFISQHVYGIAGERTPILHLRSAEISQLSAVYLDAFERIWAAAAPLS